MNVFFTSDTHFFHTNVMKYCPLRGERWSNVSEMNEGIIKGWNETVSDSDLVYFLGDFALTKDTEAMTEVADSLNGVVVFIKGNHDVMSQIKKSYPIILDSAVARLGKQHIAMSHTPLSVNQQKWIDFGLCGHVHDRWKIKMPGDMIDTRIRGSHAKIPIVNVGVDMWDFKPISFQDILALIQTEKTKRGMLQ